MPEVVFGGCSQHCDAPEIMQNDIHGQRHDVGDERHYVQHHAGIQRCGSSCIVIF